MTYEEALAAAVASNELDNSTFVIDKNLRTITVPKNFVLGVYNDKNTQIVPFMMPRFYNDIDLSEFNIRVNFVNANGDGDIFLVVDKEISEDSISFTWTVNRSAYLYAGKVHFVVCLIKVDGASYVTQEYNTTKATAPVLEGIEVDNPIGDEAAQDVLAQIQAAEVRANVAAAKAEVAITHYPTIIDGYWCVWDATATQYVSTGVPAYGTNLTVAYNSSTESIAFVPYS